MELLTKLAPLKSKFLKTNHSKFVTKEVSKAVMLRTKLRNQFLKKSTLEARTCYKNLDLKDINESRKFWATVKPLFSNKIKSAENIFLDESGEIIRNEVEVANVFNRYFVNMVPNNGITNNHNFLSSTDTSDV